MLDRFLGRTGYASQQIPGEPKNPTAPDNLYNFVPGTHSAIGKFERRTKQTSLEVFLLLHRNWFVAGADVLAAGGGVLAARKKR